ncbi:MAG: hypothetical protein ACK53A_02430 [Gemmatimonadota bacterium]|jgi:hypothetical protein|nr:hypothetical protein [Gemmatimonadota bacterium]
MRSLAFLVVAATLLTGCASARPPADQVVTTDFVAQVEWRTDACARTGTTLTCGITITNRGPDGTLVFSDRDVSAYADGGTLTFAAMSFAGRSAVAVNARLQNGVPQRAEFTFKDVTTPVRTIRLLEVRAALLDRADAPMPGNEASRAVQLRNLTPR